MPDINLSELLADVEPPVPGADTGAFKVVHIPDFPRHYLGLNSTNQPCLLLGSLPGAFQAPIRLALLEARFGNLHLIHPIEGEAREERLSVITCTSPDLQARAYFLHVCETILRIVGVEPSLDTIVQSVQRLIDIFRHLARPPSRSLNGLVGELFLIAASRNVAACVRAWRSTDNDRFDFSTGNVRIDVKSSTERRRIHHLSTEQCEPPEGSVGLLASVFVESSGGGKSLRELIENIESSLVGCEDLILKLQETISGTLGEGLHAAMSARFDDRLAFSSLQFYDLATVPAIRGDLPPEVSGVHFRSDLTHSAILSEVQIEAMSEAALQFLPR